MYEKDKKEIISTALEMKNCGLIQLTGGNVSLRKANGDFLITPSGLSYETMEIKDILVLNRNGEVIEGNLKPSVDTIAIKYIYDNIPEIKAVIHTHQPYALAVGLIEETFPACTTTLCNVCLGEVNVAPYYKPASTNMGIQAVKYLQGKRAVILKHHGVITVGNDLKEALYSCVYLEESAKCYLSAKAASNTVAVLTKKEEYECVEVHKTYGQNK